MKETKKSEKNLIYGNGPFWAQKLHIPITLDPLEEFFYFLNFFKILHNERG